MKRFLLIAVLLRSVLVCAESRLVIVPLSGAEHAYALQKIGKMRIDDHSACLYDKQDALLGCTPLSAIRKIVFGDNSDTPASLDNPVISAIRVYPNPAMSQLTVEGTEASQLVRVYSMQGHLLVTAVSDGTAAVDVSGLPQGSYFLQVGAEVIKFIKQ